MPRLRPLLGLSLVVLLMADCGDETSSGPSGGVATVEITPPAATRIGGQTFQGLFRATAKDAGGAVVQNTSFTWTSSNTAVATVAGGVGAQGNPINVTTLAVGTTTITATCQGKTGTAQLTVQVSDHPAVITGRVYDATSPTLAAIAGATVDFKTLLGVPVSTSATTSADGTFSSPDLADIPDGVIDVTARATGYVSVTQSTVFVPDPSQTITIEPFPLVPASTSKGGITGTVRNARDNTGIANAAVKLYTGNGGTGAVLESHKVGTTTADGAGVFSFTALAAGTYTIDASAAGFSHATRTAIAVGNNGVTADQNVVLSPSGTNDIRIVLTWGADPSDLDAHLTGPNADATRFHVYYPSANRGNLTAPPFALLDVDDQVSFGPETITITQLNSGTYRFSVHDYSNKSSASSTALGSSGAKVEIYTTGEHRTLFVPNQPGTLWTVFELTGTDIATPTITERNVMGVAEDPDGILDARPRTGGGNDAGLIARAIRGLQKAKVH